MSQAKPNTVVPPCRGLSAPYVAAQKHFDLLSAVCGQGPTGEKHTGHLDSALSESEIRLFGTHAL